MDCPAQIRRYGITYIRSGLHLHRCTRQRQAGTTLIASKLTGLSISLSHCPDIILLLPHCESFVRREKKKRWMTSLHFPPFFSSFAS